MPVQIQRDVHLDGLLLGALNIFAQVDGISAGRRQEGALQAGVTGAGFLVADSDGRVVNRNDTRFHVLIPGVGVILLKSIVGGSVLAVDESHAAGGEVAVLAAARALADAHAGAVRVRAARGGDCTAEDAYIAALAAAFVL